MQNGQFGLKIKYAKNERILKMSKNGHNAKAIYPMQNGQIGLKIKYVKNMRQTFVQTH